MATKDDPVTIDYTNYRGERALRRVIPMGLRFGSNAWHKESQWLLEVFDEERQHVREFAMKDIHGWKP